MNAQELTQVALLGTERQSAPTISGNSSLARLGAQMDPSTREQAFLSTAALTFGWSRAGLIPAKVLSPGFSECPAESLPRVSDRAGSLLLRLVDGDHPGLLSEWLQLTRNAGQLAVPESLPKLLQIGASQPELQSGILASMGERGKWLASLNPEWSWVMGAVVENEELWETGEPIARIAFLKRVRLNDPTKALQLLKQTWKDESPEERALFLDVLEVGLAARDEAFLEAALDDKRKEVRRRALRLLARLPESAYTKRMIERARPLLNLIPARGGSLLKLKKGKAAAIELALPSACDKPMQRDGIEPKPEGGFGEKIWWLIQMLEGVPLESWTSEWKTGITEILEASRQTEWKRELLEAWTRAAITQVNPEWAAEILEMELKSYEPERLTKLFKVLTPSQQETWLIEIIGKFNAKDFSTHCRMLAECRHSWSADFSNKVLVWLKKAAAVESYDWQARNLLQEFAARLAPETLSEAEHGWPTESKGWEFWSKGVDELLAVTQFRLEMHRSFHQPA